MLYGWMIFRLHQPGASRGLAWGALFFLAACSAHVPEVPAGLVPRTVQLERVPPVKNLSVSLLPRGEVSRLVPEEYDTL